MLQKLRNATLDDTFKFRNETWEAFIDQVQ